MRTVHADTNSGPSDGPCCTDISQTAAKRKSYRMTAAACLIAAFAVGCATAPVSTPPPAVGEAADSPARRNYFQRLAKLNSDKDGGLVYWATYGH